MDEIKDERVLAILRDYGWHVDRKVDVSREIEYLTREGWEIFPAAREFIQNFNDIPDMACRNPIRGIRFKTSQADDNRGVVVAWEKKYKCKLYPVGEYGQILTIYISDSGNLLYSDLDSFMATCGTGINQGLAMLYFPINENISHYNLERIIDED